MHPNSLANLKPPWKPGMPSPNPAGRPINPLSITNTCREILNGLLEWVLTALAYERCQNIVPEGENPETPQQRKAKLELIETFTHTQRIAGGFIILICPP